MIVVSERAASPVSMAVWTRKAETLVGSSTSFPDTVRRARRLCHSSTFPPLTTGFAAWAIRVAPPATLRESLEGNPIAVTPGAPAAAALRATAAGRRPGRLPLRGEGLRLRRKRRRCRFPAPFRQRHRHRNRLRRGAPGQGAGLQLRQERRPRASRCARASAP